MKLYYSPGACSLAAHIALIEAGIDYDKVRVDLKAHKTENGEDFYAINPRGYVPAIDTGEFGLLTENPAVLAYVADKAGTLPTGEGFYRLLEWVGFIGTELHKNFKPLFHPEDEADKRAAREALAEKYALVERLIDGREWLGGDMPNVADNYLLVTMLWAKKFDVELPDSLRAYRKRSLARPAVEQAMAEEGLMEKA